MRQVGALFMEYVSSGGVLSAIASDVNGGFVVDRRDRRILEWV